MGMAPGSSTASSRFAESATPPMLSWWWSQWASPLGTGAVMASLRPSPSRRLYPHRVSVASYQMVMASDKTMSFNFAFVSELQTANCWCKATGGTPQLESWQDITTELRNALSTSSDAFLLSKHMTYSITAASQGSVILPSPGNPNSSCDILRSSPKTVVPRYGNGTLNRLPSAVYTAQWPLSATGDVVQQASSSLAAVVLTLCSLLAS
uniref:Uncharacterized protein n=1 Tax=Oryza meridionalis TaxID=40149 RepID=A0A0E0EUI5_9ORYZ